MQIMLFLDEDAIPAREEVRKVTEMLGINIHELACEGRLVCFAAPKNAAAVVRRLRKFNPRAAIIGEVTKGDKVVVDTILGRRIMPWPTGRIVPRIC